MDWTRGKPDPAGVAPERQIGEAVGYQPMRSGCSIQGVERCGQGSKTRPQASGLVVRRCWCCGKCFRLPAASFSVIAAATEQAPSSLLLAVSVGQRCHVRRVLATTIQRCRRASSLATGGRQCCCRRICRTGWPDDHVVWSILRAVDQMELRVFYRRIGDDQGGAVFEPSSKWSRSCLRIRAREQVLARDQTGVPGVFTYKLVTAMRSGL